MEVLGRFTEEVWQAILHNDAAYDQEFIYALKTTGIFCKPSCKSRTPNKQNVYIFENAEQAISAHFRPCKRCKPTNERLPDHEWVDQITNYINMNYHEPLKLQTIADMCHGSPYHLHRTFKRIMGETPVEYIQQLRIDKATEFLRQSNKSISDISVKIGMPNTSYFITLFKKRVGLTPREYRDIHNNKQDSEVLENGS